MISAHREKRDAGCDVTATPHICVHTATRAIARRRNNLVPTSSLHASDPPRRLVFESFLELLTYLRTKPAQASSTVYQTKIRFVYGDLRAEISRRVLLSLYIRKLYLLENALNEKIRILYGEESRTVIN